VIFPAADNCRGKIAKPLLHRNIGAATPIAAGEKPWRWMGLTIRSRPTPKLAARTGVSRLVVVERLTNVEEQDWAREDRRRQWLSIIACRS
jgi:hypothetical protein